MSCIQYNPINGKKSVLFDKLEKAFGTYELAEEALNKVHSPWFKNRFGAYTNAQGEKAISDWVTEGAPEVQYINNPNMANITEPEGEPLLHTNKYNQHYFELADGDRLFLNKKKFPEFSPNEVIEITNQLFYDFVKDKKNFDFTDKTVLAAEKVLPLIQSSMDAYVKKYPTQQDKVDKILLRKQEFAEEIIDRIKETGFKLENNAEKADGGPMDEISEDDKIEMMNIKSSYETSSKDKARANTKIILSQVKNRKVVIKDGKRVAAVQRGKYLAKPSFVEFDDVWNTLQPLLADIVGTGQSDGEVKDVFSVMLKRIASLNHIKPWTIDLGVELLKLGNTPTGINKQLEFVQSFSLARLNFNVTEFNSDTSTYTIINATNTNSKTSQIKNEWGQKFKDEFVTGQGVNENNFTRLEGIEKKLVKIQEQLLHESKKTKDIEFPEIRAISEISADLIKTFKEIGIEIEGRHLEAFIRINKNPLHNVNKLISITKQAISKAKSSKTLIVNGEYKSPFEGEPIITLLGQAKGIYAMDMSDNVILMNDGKMAWTYSNPSYIHNKVNTWKNDPEKRAEMNAIAFNQNSRWAKQLTGHDLTPEGELILEKIAERELASQFTAEGLRVSVAGSFKSRGKNDGDDSKSISKTDTMNESIAKTLQTKGGKNKPIFSTIIAADKSTKYEIEGFDFFKSNTDFGDDGWIISDETVNVFLGYFEDEYNRMKTVQDEIATLPPEKLVAHYHKGNTNGLKSQLFPSLSVGVAPAEVSAVLYSEGKIFDNRSETFSDGQKKALRPFIKEAIIGMLNKNTEDLISNSILHRNTENRVYISKNLDKNVVAKYKHTAHPSRAIVGDWAINSLIANVEYGKMFAGDPAYYKNADDMIKRIPGTYTDGLQLSLKNSNELIMNVAIVDGVEVPSKYYSKIAKSFKDKALAKAYKNVNTTDAQAWITPSRWRFLKQKLGQWGNVQESAYKKMMEGKKLNKEEMKLAAQPLKGVYFGMDQNGLPTYLKYSQAVIIPHMAKGTAMDVLYKKMTINPKTKKPWSDELDSLHKEIHEVITIDGIKVGAMGSVPINKKGSTEMLQDFDLNVTELSNRNWKLQQDLPVKTHKQTNLGSQIQKTILSELSANFETEYNVGGKVMTGKEVLDDIIGTVSDLSNKGMERVKEHFDIDENDRIRDVSSLYKYLIDEFKKRGANENVISSLEKEMPFDAIPQIGTSIQSVFLSKMNKEMVKIQTNGGAYIQVSPFGFEQMIKEGASSIKIVSDNYSSEGLLPPRIENGKVLPGQAFLPHSAIAKFLPPGVDINKLSGKELMKYIDPSALEVITYRIPNQGMSSNDMLEIVGILPEGMGDSIMAYDAIPAKTGSDFDIDKMFAMMPNYHFNGETGKVEAVPYDNSSRGLKATQNRLFDLYKGIMSSPSNYDNMMKSIDAGFLKDSINDLHPRQPLVDLQHLSPTHQINTKFEYMSGKFGVAQTANQLVDHISNQSLNIHLGEYLGVGNKDENGFTKFDDLEDSAGVNKIGDVLSAFLNAYVDIAKDPYISRGNHNNITANTTFMLIRAGVPLNWVNGLMGQPILKDLVKYTKMADGKSAEKLQVDGQNATAAQFLAAKYKLSGETVSYAEIGAITEKDLKDNIDVDLNNMTDTQRKFQNVIFEAFHKYENTAKKFTGTIMASKADTKGSNGSVVARLIIENQVEDAIDGDIRGIREKLKGATMVANYTANAIDWIGDVLDKSDLFLSGKKGMSALFNLVSTRVGRGKLKDRELGRTIESSYNTYIGSKLSLFSDLTDKKVHDDLFNKLPERLIKYKAKTKNFFTDALDTKFSGNTNYIVMNSMNKPKSHQNHMYRGWSALIESKDKTERKLGLDLVKYAYAQSGYRNNLNQFYTHTPHNLLLQEGINQDVKAAFADTENMIDDEFFMDQMYRHNWENDKLVPEAHLYGKTAKKDYKLIGGFTYVPNKQSKGIEIKDPVTGQVTFPEFVKASIGEDPVSGVKAYGLYKLYRGEIVKDKVQAVYRRTHKLGTKSNHGSVYEYSFDKQSTGSVVTDNSPYSSKLVQAEIRKLAADTGQFVTKESLLTQIATPRGIADGVRGDIFESSTEKLLKGIFNNENLDALPQEERNVGTEEDIATFEQKINHLKANINAEVLIDPDVETSRLLPASDPRSIEAGKPVILINPDKVFKTTAIHEFAHIFVDVFPGGLNNPRIKAAIAQLQGTEVYRQTKELYPDLSDEMFNKELLAQAIGIEGSKQWDNAQEQSVFQGFVNWFFDYLKRIFGLQRNEVKALTTQMLSNKTDVTSFSTQDIQEERVNPVVNANLNKIEHEYSELLIRIKNLHNMYKPRTKKQKIDEYNATIKGVESPRMRLTKLANTIQEFENKDKEKGFFKYAEWSDKGLNYLSDQIDDLIEGENTVTAEDITRHKGYLNSFGMLGQIKGVVEEEYQKGNITKKRRNKLQKQLNASIGTYSDAKTKLDALARRSFAEYLVLNSNSHKTRWENKFRSEYNVAKPKGFSNESEYIISKMGENKAQIDSEAFDYYLSKATASVADISGFEGFLVSEKNVSSEEVQVMSDMIDDIDQRVDIFSTEEAGRAAKAFTDFNKDAQGLSSKAKYGKFLDFTDGSGTFLASKYSPKYLEADRESKGWQNPDVYNERYKDTKSSGNSYTYEGKTKEFFLPSSGKVVGEFYVFDSKKKEDIPIKEAIARSERKYWLKDNTVEVINSYNEVTGIIPKDKWKSKKYAELSVQDKETLKGFKEQIVEADDLYDNERSLIAHAASQQFMRIPGILASSLDRITQGQVVGTLADQLKDLVKVRDDEFEYASGRLTQDKKTTTKGVIVDTENKEKFNIPVPFRAVLSEKEQSFDLHTILLLNKVAAKNNQAKKTIDDTLNVFIGVMTDRAAPSLEGLNNLQKVHVFGEEKLRQVFKPKDRLPNDVKKLISMQEHRVYDIKKAGSGSMHKKASAVLKYAGMNSLIGNWVASTVNLMTGTVNNLVEAVGGEHYNLKNALNAERKYWKDLKGNISDIGANVHTSKTNLFMNIFNVMGARDYLANNFEENNRLKSLSKINNLRPIAQGGEHMMQAKVMYSVMDATKVLNKKGEFLNKEGKVVSEKDAATLDEVMSFHKMDDGAVKMILPDFVKATTHTLEGGHENILLETRSLIKKKIIDLHGVYDSDIQADVQRYWYGKALFFLRKWMMPTLQRRWRGVATARKSPESLREMDVFYSQDLKSNQEGYYVTAIRFFTKVLPDAFKEGGFEMVKQGYGNMSKMEKANMRKLLAELSSIAFVTLAYAAAGGFDDDPTKESLYARYILRREIAELTFYMNPLETYRIAATPSAVMGFMEKNLRLIAQFTAPTELYEQGPFKGQLKISKKSKDLIPLVAQYQRDIDASLKFLQW